jgi:hypothetical protein
MGVSVLGFFDDITIYVHGNVKENTEKLSKLLAVGTKWARDHYTDIDLGDKGFIHFRAPKQEREKAHETPLLLPDGGVKAPQEEVKWLLEGCYHGLTGASFRQLFMTCVLPLMEYGIEAWYKESNKTQKEHLQRRQNRGLRRTLGAVRDTPMAVLHVESSILPLQERCLRLQFYITLPLRWWAWCRADHGRRTPPYTVVSSCWSTMSKILHHR